MSKQIPGVNFLRVLEADFGILVFLDEPEPSGMRPGTANSAEERQGEDLI